MRRPTLSCAASLALACAAPAAAQTLPAELAAFAAERSAECAAQGGTPRVGPAFATPVDLSGDGAPDYIVDLAGIECANAWSAFCGADGCPVSVWIAGPSGLARAWDATAQGWRLDAQGDAMALVIERGGEECTGDAAGCEERLDFTDAAPPPPVPAEAPVEAAEPEEAAPEVAPPAGPAASVAALAAPGVDGWTLRETPDGATVAVSDAPGVFASFALFCLGGQPWLAATLREPTPAETAQIEFAFSGRSVSSPARREAQAGGALVVELADRPLAGLLAGRDSSARVTFDGADQGVLSLKGSTKAIRGALAPCLDV